MVINLFCVRGVEKYCKLLRNVASFLIIELRKWFIAKDYIYNNNFGIDNNINYRLQAKNNS
jgi:hypothetical protein